KVSIWTDTGVLLASQNVTATPGIWTETALTTPIQLAAGVRYRIGAYAGGGAYYWRFVLGTNFSDGTIDQGYFTSGDAFPTGYDSSRWFFVDMRYAVSTQTPVIVAPATIPSFTNGVWAGSLTVQQSNPPSRIVLLADDGAGHTGLSNPFNLMPAVGQVDH